MFFIKVILHFVLFVLSMIGLQYYFDLNVYVTLLTLIHVYVASYYVSLWAVKFVFLFPCTKIKTDNKSVLITGETWEMYLTVGRKVSGLQFYQFSQNVPLKRHCFTSWEFRLNQRNAKIVGGFQFFVGTLVRCNNSNVKNITHNHVPITT